MNIKPELDNMYLKLDSNLKNLHKKKKLISNDYKNNIIKIQETLSKNQEELEKSIAFFQQIESYFSYSKSNENLQNISYISNLIKSIPLDIDMSHNYYNFFFQNQPELVTQMESNINSILSQNGLAIIIYRHFQHHDLNYSLITPQTIVKYFLFELKSKTNINYNFLKNLHENILQKDNLHKIDFLNEKIKESLNNFYVNTPNFFLSFELYLKSVF